MPRATKPADPLADQTEGELDTRVLHNHRIGPLANKFGPARGVAPFKVGLPVGVPCNKTKKQVNCGRDDDTAEGRDDETGATCKVKLRCAFEPPEGWEEHMFGYRDWRSFTPTTSHQQQTPQDPTADTHSSNEHLAQAFRDVENDEEQEGSAKAMRGPDITVDSPCISNASNDLSLQDGSNYSSNAHACAAKKAAERSAHPSGDHSSLPPSSPPPESHSGSDTDTQNPCSRCKKRKIIQSHQGANTTTIKGGDKGLSVNKKPGALSNAALEEIRIFSDESTWDILVAAGFGVKPSHAKVNEANLFHSWYWATQPRPEGASRDKINDIITKEYNILMKDIPKDDIVTRKEKLKDVYEWQETSLMVPSNKSVKLIATKLDNAKVQFSGLAKSWCNLEEIEIVSVLMYVREDPAGHQLSGIFAGSDLVRKFINDHAIDICTLIDKYTSIFKNSDGLAIGLDGGSGCTELAPAVELQCRPREIPRDWDCRIFRSMMREKLTVALRDQQVRDGIEGGDPQKISWQKLLKFVRKNHLIITNWPLGVPPPGPSFDFKKLKAGSLHRLVVPYLHRKLGIMYDRQSDEEDTEDALGDLSEIEVKLWHEEIIRILDMNPTKGDLLMIPNGRKFVKMESISAKK
ncbi:hypothetical protein SCLCIDRAFT_34413 [Scleroderma citrinum Foug A]|uniref:Uncharacterized protein n=1 Tax=Scleroderma citrinum Foug A TaxID=1036808 RepID=A0A0C3D1N9_9AGAM|nr:hypothetical protein SCLCIDRAFT_34413 [Scleroderma citrinum Foug A]